MESGRHITAGGATVVGGAEVPVRTPGDGSRAGRAPTGRVPDDVLLDAARECVLARGVRRTTLTDIARTAGVSRMTLYRRFPDVRSVLAALMTREFGALLREVSTHAGGAGDDIGGTEGGTGTRHARRRLVDIAVASVRALAANPLLRTVLDRDAELLLPYIVERLGATQQLAEGVVRTLIEEGHDDGSVRPAAPAAQTRSVLLVVQSFVLSHRPATADLAAQDLLDELRHLLDAALTPGTDQHGKESDE
ncbi:TetR/AcrR family transcriptional regulator [Saccharomonospora iraqiensis]|uniref:TetR/AcrR family transcriptional regulator n=1 Tax=Saccharomonospora iraqiensis TaxID=52698 RepID=UPI00022E079C|nr:TetR/AcrR family transcriptional regulator [Saccharomonospora iraqiensis]